MMEQKYPIHYYQQMRIVKIGTLLIYRYLSLYIIEREGILQSYLSNIGSQAGQGYDGFYRSSI